MNQEDQSITARLFGNVFHKFTPFWVGLLSPAYSGIEPVKKEKCLIFLTGKRANGQRAQPIDYGQFKTSFRASSNTSIPSRSASSVIVSGGAILTHSPLEPTGANI